MPSDDSEIRSLLCRERYYRDTCQWENLRNAYHPDSSLTEVNVSWYKGTVDGFVRESERLSSAPFSVMHSINPVEIDVRNTKALSVSLGTIASRFRDSGNDFDLTSWCRFVSRLEKFQAGKTAVWKLLSLEVVYIRDSITPASPMAQPILMDFSSVKDWRPSYKYLAWHIMKRGIMVNPDLPGEDDEASVKELLSRNLTWICSS